jgi:hypothetical protein
MKIGIIFGQVNLNSLKLVCLKMFLDSCIEHFEKFVF